MTCAEHRASMDRELLGDADAAERERLSRHLETCPPCRTLRIGLLDAVDALRRTRSALEAAAPAFDAIAGRSLERALGDSPQAPPGRRADGPSRRWAAACFLVVAIPFFWLIFQEARHPSGLAGSPPQDAREIAGLLADLRADDAAVRERAVNRFTALGPALRARLTRELREERDPEVRGRLRTILNVYDWQDLVGIDLGSSLAGAGSLDSRTKLLIRSLQGPPALRLPADRKAALARLLFEGCSAEERRAFLGRYTAAWPTPPEAREQSWLLVPLLAEGDLDLVSEIVNVMRTFDGTQDPALHSADLAARLGGLLASPKAEVRISAMDVLGRLKARSQAAKVAAFLRDPEAGLRSTALSTLGEMQAAEFLPEIAARLLDREEDVRISAVDALHLLKADAYAEPVAKLLEDPSDEVRGRAYRALGTFGRKDYVPRMLRALREGGKEKSSVKLGAMNGLVELLDRGEDLKAFAPDVAVLLDDADPGLRLAGLSFLKSLGGKTYVRKGEKLLGDPDDWVRSAAAQYLGAWGDARSLVEVRRALTQEKDPQVTKALEAAEASLKQRP